ncbi:MAG: polyisoprenoid-binding protein [Burkholderiaceae bacterium]|nr:polyisoprenoid-binding protein [Burkholderiaceae bacterium]
MRHSFRALAAAATLAALSMGTAQAQSATYVLDPTHTFVTFEIGHFGTSTNRGRFDKKEGTVQFDRAGKTGKVDLTIDATSISTGTPPFDKHLQSADLFNAAKFPTIQFSADQFRFNGDKVSEVAGKLTLLGQTHPVTLKANTFNCYQSPMLKREVCGGDFETTIDRTQWGMDYGVSFGMPKTVRLIVQAEAIKQ